jgi:hypothetical protein
MELLWNRRRYLSLYFVSSPANYYRSQTHFSSLSPLRNCLSVQSLFKLLLTSMFISLYCLSMWSLTQFIDFDKYLFNLYQCITQLISVDISHSMYLSLLSSLLTNSLDISHSNYISLSLTSIDWRLSLSFLLSLSYLFLACPSLFLFSHKSISFTLSPHTYSSPSGDLIGHSLTPRQPSYQWPHTSSFNTTARPEIRVYLHIHTQMFTHALAHFSTHKIEDYVQSFG